MDIRSFFGGKRETAKATLAADEPAVSTSATELKTTIRRKIEDPEATEELHSAIYKRGIEAVKHEAADDDTVLGVSRRKRLKRLVDSDDETVEASSTSIVANAGSKDPHILTVRNLLAQELGPAVVSTTDVTGKPSDLQLDIDCYTTNEKRLVNPIANVKADDRNSVDLDSYLASIEVGIPTKGSATASAMDRSPKKARRVASPKAANKAANKATNQATNTTTKEQRTSTGVPTQLVPTQDLPAQVPLDASLGATATTSSTGGADLIGEDEVLPSSEEPSPVASPTRRAKKKQPTDSPPSDGKVTGMRFVFTGVLEAIDRDSVLQLVRDLGGFPISGVSGKTNYLVCGAKLEDGRAYTTGTKYKKAVELNSQQRADIKILNEAEFLELIEYDKVSSKLAAAPEPAPQAGGPPPALVSQESNRSLPFCEKYRPSRVSDLAGNEANIRKVVEWLRAWTPGSTPACALLSGPPGVGKTTTAKLVAAECGYECVEFNASDLRNKSAVEKIAMLVTGGQSFSFLGQCEMKRSLVLLDEVDGMGAGDRGGLQAVVALLPRARCPVICICNDRHNQKMTTLGNKSLDVRFAAPTLLQFRNRISRVCAAEGVTVSPDTVAQLYEQGGGDFRHALNAIEFNAVHASGAPSTASSVGDPKDIGDTKNIFEAVGRLFKVKSSNVSARFRELEQIFFMDYNLMPLMVQENYVKYLDPGRRGLRFLKALSYTFVEADIVEEFLKRRQAFSLLPDLAVLSAIIPAMGIVSSGGTCRERLMFPQFLGRYSTTNKNRRFLGEIGKHFGPRSLVRASALVTDGYLNIVYTKVRYVPLCVIITVFCRVS
ncbi:replication factor C subunit 1, putative [Babesia caballi]|uniref:Replication factor C subunit 1 n=1 Tax=Babesia caballi TaxID=5871 RepID=A0AAV4LR74_BABCB|nr:replication factor C subunit 1, putative [Babesia caballi]